MDGEADAPLLVFARFASGSEVDPLLETPGLRAWSGRTWRAIAEDAGEGAPIEL